MPTTELLVLDTDVWVQVAVGKPKLASKIAKRIEAAANVGALLIAAITPWEIGTLVAHGKLRLSGPTLDWIARTIHATKVAVAPLEPTIAIDATELPLFHGDPADRLIVATARHLLATLVTRDTKILEYAQATKNVRVLEA